MTSYYFRTDQTYEEWLKETRKQQVYVMSEKELKQTNLEWEIKQCKNT